MIIKEVNGENSSNTSREFWQRMENAAKEVDKMLIEKIEEAIKKNGDGVAIQTHQREYTFNQLNLYANKIALDILRKFDGEDKSTIGLLFQEASSFIIGMLVAIKLGRTYVPLSLEYPKERLVEMMEDGEIGLVLTETKGILQAIEMKNCSEGVLKVVNEDEYFTQKAESMYDDVQVEEALYEDITYLLYTSGSTGKPKAVMQSGENILYYVEQYIKNFKITSEDRLTLFSSLNHDAAVMDIYTSLISGATLYPFDIRNMEKTEDLIQWLQTEEITLWHSVPTIYRLLVQSLNGEMNFPALKHIVLGGEAVRRSDLESFQKFFPTARLYNLYGQTEASYNSGEFFNATSKIDKITLGRVNNGTEIFLVDDEGNEVGPLETGEIIIISEHSAIGYWKRHELSKEKFITSPMGKIYRTGDLGKLLLDGRIEFVGRRDSQVKIRGYRVELGEIESMILQHPKVKEVVVLGKSNPQEETYLIGYVVADGEITSVELQKYLSAYLPDYMIPKQVMQLECFPMTSTKKVDRRALGEMEIHQEKKSYEAPNTNLEIKMAEIWQEILEITPIGRQNRFFQLGGNSINIIALPLQRLVFLLLNNLTKHKVLWIVTLL